MAGKAYTMREMKNIVEYLAERKAYGEIKGRKMWMEFANSQHTTRSWQSLKETFLKRILPDLHNPYYKLSLDEVRSFRQGCDVAEKEKKGRLEIRTTSQESNANANGNLSNDNNPTTSRNDGVPTTGNDNEPSTTNIENEMENATGENTSAKIASRNRSSADTLVLEYENAEDVQRVLESPQDQDDVCNSKSLKDLLSFEPMTPLVKELLDDFETESESSDKEPQLKIVEETEETSKKTDAKPMRLDVIPFGNVDLDNDVKIIDPQNSEGVIPIPTVDSETITIEDTAEVEEQNKNDEPQKDLAPKEIQDKNNEPQRDSEQIDIPTISDHVQNKILQTDIQEKSKEPHKSKYLKLKQSQKNKLNKQNKAENNNNDENQAQEEQLLKNDTTTNITLQDSTEFVTAESSNVVNTSKQKKTNVIDNTGNSTQNTGNTSSDTILPNNQEGLDHANKTTQITNFDQTMNDVTKEENDKKNPANDDVNGKKQKLSDDKSNEVDDIHGRVTPVIELKADTPLNSHDTESIVTNNTEIPNNRVIEINTDTPTTNTEEQLNVLYNQENKPSTSNQGDISNVSTKEDKNVEVDGDKNPCLLSVSLYDEQFKDTKYSDDSDNEAAAPQRIQHEEQTEIRKKKEENPQKEETRKREVKLTEVQHDQNKGGIQESSADNDFQKQRIRNKSVSVDNKALSLQREKALANVFGFAHGTAASTSRKRRLSHRRSHRRQRRRYSKDSSDSSEWTSESDSDCFVSPPRGRKNRHTRKYLKPKYSRILQDPEEGMLFVMFGKNIYPIVKDGKHIKNYLAYRPDSDSEMEEESYWKQKYVDEKKRVDEYKKMLRGTRDDKADANDRAMPSSPRNGNLRSPQKHVQNRNASEVAPQHEAKPEAEAKNDKMIIKIASKNGLEYCLEGGWTQIKNAMPQMVQILRNECNLSDNKYRPSSRKRVDSVRTSKSEEAVEVSSGTSTPVHNVAIDPEIHEKVNVIETEIFKEIEMREKEEQIKEKEVETANVTTRRYRTRQASSSSVTTAPNTPAKKTRISKASTESKDPKPANKRKSKQKQEEQTEVNTSKSKRASNQQEVTNEILEPAQNEIEKPSTRSEKAKTEVEVIEQIVIDQDKLEQVIEEQPEQNTRRNTTEEESTVSIEQKPPSRRESLRLSKQREIVDGVGKSPTSTRSSSRRTVTPRKYETDSSVASDSKRRAKKSASKESKLLLPLDDEEARYMFPPTPKTDKISPKKTRIRRSPRLNKDSSMDHGYLDSDSGSRLINLPKRKRKLSLKLNSAQRKYRNRRTPLRNSCPIFHEYSSDSNSTFFVPLRKSQTSINSDIYKTDSYVQLVPMKIKEPLSRNKLAPIDESGLTQTERSIRHFDPVSKDSKSNDSILLEVGSSSNMSLPLSPELSVVEKLSVSREIIKNGNHPTINELQSSENNNNMDFSEYMIANLDASMPLMHQKCILQITNQKTPTKNTTKSVSFSDPQLKEATVKVENLTLSQSLDQRLKDLLLESSKKITIATDLNVHAMEVDCSQIATTRQTRSKSQKEHAMDVDETKIAKTAKGKKKTKADNNKENAIDDKSTTQTRITRSKSQKEGNVDVDKTKPAKTIKGKTRSSTPQKKKSAEKAKKVLPNPVIEEEHMEFCSYGGRRSCPPVMRMFSIDENANNSNDVNLNFTQNAIVKKKKDVIKVKIQRPTSREKVRKTSAAKTSTTSIYTDSGINDTENLSGSLLKGNDSIDLIHNHSETCLMANECIANSVEFVDMSESIISINSDQSYDSELKRLFENAAADISQEMFANDNWLDKPASESKRSEDIPKVPETEYFSHGTVNSSLITDDMSDEPPSQPTKWYLFSEDETNLPASALGSFGSNLRQIFPITCSVPNLSTITEASNSNKQS